MKTNEWNLLKEQFDALVHNEGLHEDSLEQFLDYQVHRRFGELIAAGAQHETKGAARGRALPRTQMPLT